MSWVERFEKVSIILSLEHLGLRRALREAFVTLGGNPPRWLGIALELPSLWCTLEKFVKVRFAFERNEAKLVD